MDVLFAFLIFIPSLIGTGLGIGSLDKRLGNPPSVWIAAIWNSLISAAFVGLVFIGLIAKG